MKNILGLSMMLIFFIGACSASVPPEAIGMPAGMTKPTPAPIAAQATWHIQYTGAIDYAQTVDVYNLDLFDTPPDEIARLRERGVFVICYFSAGTREDWRPDAAQFPAHLLGKDYPGWAGEQWLDIRAVELQTIITARLDLAVQKGCNGVDPDNVDGYQNDTGFPLTNADQLTFNTWLAKAAHARGLAIGLKNDNLQADTLQPHFDWAISEACFEHGECQLWQPFIRAGKPVFVIEYNLASSEFCPQARELGFSALRKNADLDAYTQPCP